jgi:hypothetical protein
MDKLRISLFVLVSVGLCRHTIVKYGAVSWGSG